MLDDFNYSGYSILLQLIEHLQKENVDICSSCPISHSFYPLNEKSMWIEIRLIISKS